MFRSVLVAERYQLDFMLGRGGMGEVWHGTDGLLGREVAVKLLPSAADPDTVARFHLEARTAASLSHPNVVTVYDFGEHQGGLYLAMELVPGSTLAQELRNQGPLPVDRAAGVASDIAAGLAAAHRLGIVHRDVKPANLFTTAEGTVKIGDFGIARITDDPSAALTSTGQIIGTSLYLAPERALGRPAEPASDVYALGCVLYELLTGAPPFRADSLAGIMHQHLDAAPEPLRHQRPDLPPTFEGYLMGMLVKDPARRPTADHAAAWFASAAWYAEPAPTAPMPVWDAAPPKTPPVPAPAGRSRRRAGVIAVAVGTAAAAIAGAVALSTDDRGTPPATTPTTSTASPLTATPGSQQPTSTHGHGKGKDKHDKNNDQGDQGN